MDKLSRSKFTYKSYYFHSQLNSNKTLKNSNSTNKKNHNQQIHGPKSGFSNSN